MDMHSREQYLARVREEYGKGNKRAKTRLLNEARKRARLNRKVRVATLEREPTTVFRSIGPAALGCQPAANVTITIELRHLNKARQSLTPILPFISALSSNAATAG